MSDLGITSDLNAQHLNSPSSGQEGPPDTGKSYFGSIEFSLVETDRSSTSRLESNPVIPDGRIKYFKMTGYYVIGDVFETWVVMNMPSSTPPSGHILQNVTVSGTWLA